MKFDDILSYYKEFSDITNALISQKVDNIQLNFNLFLIAAFSILLSKFWGNFKAISDVTNALITQRLQKFK